MAGGLALGDVEGVGEGADDAGQRDVLHMQRIGRSAQDGNPAARRCAPGRMILRKGFRFAPGPTMMFEMDAGAIKAAAAASSASYRSFADATRSVLDLLERLMPGCALYLAHLDRTHAVHRIVDTRGGADLGLRSNLATPIDESFDVAMTDGRGPRIANDLTARAGLRRAGHAARARAPAPTSACRSSCPTAPASARSPRSPARPGASGPTTSSSSPCSPACSPTSSSASPTSATSSGSTTTCATTPAAWARSAASSACWPAATTAAGPCAAPRARWRARRSPSCSSRPGREFVSTAMSGVDMAPVTIQPRPDTTGRAFTARESYFVPDARSASRARPAARRRHVRPLGAVRAGAARRPGLRRADRDLAAADRVGAGGHVGHAAPARRPGRRRDRARGPACPDGDADADRRADGRRDPARARGRAAARAGPRAPQRLPRLDRHARPRPPRRVQHAARRARGRTG